MFLDTIIAEKYMAVKRSKEVRPISMIWRELEQNSPEIRPFKSGLTGNAIRLIAEVKKASPSKGLLCSDFNPKKLGICYEQAGASAISVLTEVKYFLGALNYLSSVKTVTNHTPVLRKDFIVDPYQLAEARWYGADAVLLIVAALTPQLLTKLYQETINLGMAALVEVHNRDELQQALASGSKIIGINNRNLHTFEVKLETTLELASEIPEGHVIVSESGISSRNDVLQLKNAGVNAILVGESLVTSADPAHQIKNLLGVIE
jgi:indole-3-glycerol phosphate synthase